MFLLIPPLMVWLDGTSNFIEASAVIDDQLQRSRAPSSQGPSEVVIVEIDKRSLESYGAWPWPRQLHALLLEQLAHDSPRGVLFDVFLDSAGTGEHDSRLAQAMRKVPTYLPLAFDPATGPAPDRGAFRMPIATFMEQAAGVGHANARPDPDGLVRNLWRFEGTKEGLHPYIGYLMTMQARDLAFKTPSAPSKDGWIRRSRFGVPFASAAHPFQTFSFLDVMRGNYAPGTFRSKYVLVGASVDSGLSDVQAVPGAALSRNVAGIEVHAAAIDAILKQEIVEAPQDGWHILWIVVPIWIALAFFLVNAEHAVAAALVVAASLCAIFFVLRVSAAIELPLAAPLAGVALAYLLWSWRSLVALLEFFKERADALNAVPMVALEKEDALALDPVDSVDRRTGAFDRAIDRMARLQTLLTEGIWHLPIPVLLCRADGTINQSNAAAQVLFGVEVAPLADQPFDPRGNTDPLKDASLIDLLGDQQRADLPGQLQAHLAPAMAQAMTGEYTTGNGRVFRVQAAPLSHMRDMTAPTWVVAMPDVTAERQAQKEREQWFGFLSHDLRSPQVTILSMLAMLREHPKEMPLGKLVNGIEAESRRTLHLTEAFMDMVEAESGFYDFAPVMPGSILLDAIDATFAAAEGKGLTLTSRLCHTADHLILADGALLTRAVTNLLTNAIRFTPPGHAIALCIDTFWNETRNRAEAVFGIRDEGAGMSAEQLASLMRTHQRRKSGTPGAGHGWGIGMSIVHAVIARHDGWIDAISAPGAGTTFLIGVPLHHGNQAEVQEFMESNSRRPGPDRETAVKQLEDPGEQFSLSN